MPMTILCPPMRKTDTMFDEPRLALTQMLELQLRDYWHDVDANWGRNAHLYYTEDGVFEGSSGVLYEGRNKIAEFYRYRESRGARTVIHAVTNFRAEMTGEYTALSTWFLHLYAADGTPPHDSTAPILLAAMTDTHRRDADGRWLCTNRHFGTLFKGGIPVTALPGASRKAQS